MAGGSLPNRVPPQSQPLAYQGTDGQIHVDLDWYLFFYALGLNIVGADGSVTIPPVVNIPIINSYVVDTDSLQINRLSTNGLAQAQDRPDSAPTFQDFSNVMRLALDERLVESTPTAQPVAAVTVGASPFTYTALFNGTLSVTGGVVSNITLTRQGTAVATGLTTGLIPVSRLDQVAIIYTGLPTVIFLPT